jgi:serine protease Do
MELSDAIQVVRPSVVQVGVWDGRRCIRVGTGFVADDAARVVTADHVLAAADDALAPGRGDKLVVGFAQRNREDWRGNFTYLPCDVLARDEGADLAVVQPHRNPLAGEVGSGLAQEASEVPLLAGAASTHRGRPRDGDPIAVSGYPVAEPVLVTTGGIVASSWGFDLGQLMQEDLHRVADLQDLYLVDAIVNPGNSGGPVYRVSDGRVIGVCLSFRMARASAEHVSFAYNSGLTLVAPIAAALDLMAATG